MEEIEKENNTYKDILDQLQGKLDAILELIRTQKDNTSTITETPTKTEAVAQPIPNQPGSLPGPSGNGIVHP